MKLFKRKKEDEEYDDDELEVDEERGERRLTRKFRDFKPENQNLSAGRQGKRKEPPKPWGRKERLIVLVALILTILISGILTLTSHRRIFPGFSKFSFNFKKLDFRHLNIFGEETFEIRKK